MKYDEVIQLTGEFGPYQKKIFLLTCLPALSTAIQTMITIFILAVPDYRCAIPGLDNDTYKIDSDDHWALLNYTIIWSDADPDNANNKWGSGQCHVIANRTAKDLETAHRDVTYSNTTETCHSWTYDKSFFSGTYISEHNWVCQDMELRSHVNMIYMAGVLTGSLISGLVSDRFGRKKALLVSIVAQVASSISLAFAPNFITLAVLRFFTGIGDIGIYMCCFVLAIELVGPVWRAQVGVLITYFWCAGLFVLNGAAYAIRDWKILQLVLSCPTFLLFIIWWFMPESPRWLLNRGKLQEARVILDKIASANKTTLPESIVDVEKEGNSTGKFIDIFKYSVLALRALIVFINWFGVTLVFYGLTFNVATLGGDIYLNFFLSSVVETLGYTLCLLAIPRIGRKRFHCLAMFLSGGACLSFVIPAFLKTKEPWVSIFLSSVGKFGASGGYATMFVMTAELFPTQLRNRMVGTCSMVARIAGMVSPYIADLGVIVGGSTGSALPFLVFGSCGIITAILTLFLPETLNQKLPETVEEAINFGRFPKDKTLEILSQTTVFNSQGLEKFTTPKNKDCHSHHRSTANDHVLDQSNTDTNGHNQKQTTEQVKNVDRNKMIPNESILLARF
ncbi:organic cation transporter protein-like [Biomphalaria glabrata]|uniref:Organic cation transporter protein-like n=1 Tax=Biomphalaria glabrata TaxID=6526 RepID=A0A9W3BH24_BIOGL|nr:organic cation transporter protein-like [Biomphalaria glabrata]XP_055898792.1 organic cation transporter protein-like [Biomphalaria glabrata]